MFMLIASTLYYHIWYDVHSVQYTFNIEMFVQYVQYSVHLTLPYMVRLY